MLIGTQSFFKFKIEKGIIYNNGHSSLQNQK